MSRPQRETVTTERVALVAWRLAQGRAMSTRQVAELTRLTRFGAWQMMQLVARVLPVYQDDDGQWRAVAEDASQPH